MSPVLPFELHYLFEDLALPLDEVTLHLKVVLVFNRLQSKHLSDGSDLKPAQLVIFVVLAGLVCHHEGLLLDF